MVMHKIRLFCTTIYISDCVEMEKYFLYKLYKRFIVIKSTTVYMEIQTQNICLVSKLKISSIKLFEYK
jgi:hypothetical protein